MTGDLGEDVVDQHDEEFSDETQAFVPENTTEKLHDKAKAAVEDSLDQSLFRPGTILFYLAGREQPFLFQDAEKIALGRLRDIDGGEALDLSKYDGATMGVSRQHAVVHVQPNGYFFEDLKSTNGSWLNATRVEPLTRYPLHNGDHIQMGELTLNVYFSEQEQAIATQVIELTLDEGDAADLGQNLLELTLDFVDEEVMIYLKAVAALQALVTDQARKTSVQIQSMRLSGDRRRVQIEMSAVNQALQVLVDGVLPVRTTHMEDVRMARHELDGYSTRQIVERYEQDEAIVLEYLGTAMDALIQQVNRTLPRTDATTLGRLRRTCFTLLVSPLTLVVK